MTAILTGFNHIFHNWTFAGLHLDAIILIVAAIFLFGFTIMEIKDRLLIVTIFLAGIGAAGITGGMVFALVMILTGLFSILDEIKQVISTTRG